MDIIPRLPFYEEYMASVGGLTDPEDVRTGTQISLIRRFVPDFGNFNIQEGFWAEVGNFTNHQDMFGDLDWRSTMITVRMFSNLVLFLPLRRATPDRWEMIPGCNTNFCIVSRDLCCFRSSIMSSYVVWT